MATVADELLNDFGDSDDENENGNGNENENGSEFTIPLQHGDDGSEGNKPKTDMELDDDDEEDVEDEEEAKHVKADNTEDAEEAKARVEKMALHNVSDVRTVAGLMKQLEPLLEVGEPILPLLPGHLPPACLIPAENRTLYIPRAGPRNTKHRQHRRQPGISTAHPVQHPLHRYRQ